MKKIKYTQNKIFKRLFLVSVFFGFLVCSNKSNAQMTDSQMDSIQTNIRALEITEANFLGKGDLDKLYKIWDDNFFYSEGTRVISLMEMKSMLSNKKFDGKATERSIVVHAISENVSIVMGSFRINHTYQDPNNGKYVSLTDVWIKKNGNWRLASRQNNITCSQ